MYAILFSYFAIGCIAGVLSGLFGIGGGIVIVPLLLMVFAAQGIAGDLTMLMAVATSLATIIVTAVSAVIAHQRRGAVQWRWVWHLAPGILAGAAVGARLAEALPNRILKLVFALFLLGVALRLLQKPAAAGVSVYAEKHSQSGRRAIFSRLAHLAAGWGIGLLSAIVGIGGGTLTVPYLVKRQLVMQQAVATSSACGLPIAIAGTLSYLYLGWNHPDLPAFSAGYVYLPAFAGIALCSALLAPVGARLAHRLPATQLKRWFAVLLVLVALRLLYQAGPLG